MRTIVLVKSIIVGREFDSVADEITDDLRRG